VIEGGPPLTSEVGETTWLGSRIGKVRASAIDDQAPPGIVAIEEEQSVRIDMTTIRERVGAAGCALVSISYVAAINLVA